MKPAKNISAWLLRAKTQLHTIRPMRAIICLCGGVALVALVWAICGTFGGKGSNLPVTRRLYGEEIGDNGLRYKYGDHIYDPRTGKVLLDSISWLYVGRGDTIGIVAKHNKRAYINLNTARLLTPLAYDKAWAFSSDRGVMVRKDTIYIFRRDGSIVNRHGLRYRGQYEMLYHHGKLIVRADNDMYGLLDTAANWVLPARYTYIDNNYQHQLFNTKTGEQCVVYGYELDTVLAGNYKSVDIDWSEGIVATEYNGVQHLFDYQGRMVYEVIYKGIRTLTYNTNRKDANGNPVYEDTECFVYTDYNNKCGLMDRHYRVLTPPLFHSIEAQTRHVFFASFGEYSTRFGTLIDDHGKPIR